VIAICDCNLCDGIKKDGPTSALMAKLACVGNAQLVTTHQRTTHNERTTRHNSSAHNSSQLISAQLVTTRHNSSQLVTTRHNSSAHNSSQLVTTRHNSSQLVTTHQRTTRHDVESRRQPCQIIWGNHVCQVLPASSLSHFGCGSWRREAT